MNQVNPEYARINFAANGTPEAAQFGDIYYSRTDGLAESEYVFVRQNQLCQRFEQLTPRGHFHIGETGFGTGLNILLAARAFLAHAPAGARLHLTSFERYPLTPADLHQALQQWPELAEWRTALCAQWPPPLPGLHRMMLHDRITLDLVLGDIIHTLPDWAQAHPQQTDAWFLDGFAPGKNPRMWQPELYQHLVFTMRPTATLATFTAAGHVRRGLQRAGLKVEKVPGFGSKREMLRARRHCLAPPRQPPEHRSIAIIGGGIAAACMAWSLRDHPGALTWYQPALAAGASGNPMGIVYPPTQAQWNPFTEFYSHAFRRAHQVYSQLIPEHTHWCGVQQLYLKTSDLKRFRAMRQAGHYPLAFAQGQTSQQAAFTARCEHGRPSLLLPTAGWLTAAQAVPALATRVRDYRAARGLPITEVAATVTDLQPVTSGWQLSGSGTLASQVAQHHAVVLAAGQGNAALLPQPLIPLRPVRGQVTRVKATAHSQSLAQVVCHQGYITPAHHGEHCLGATADQGSLDTAVRHADDQHNLAQANQYLLTGFTEADILGQRASVRATTPDHLPLAGPVPRYRAEDNTLRPQTGLYLLGGLGFRGFTSAPLAADMVAAWMTGNSMPVGATVQQALAPDRFARRALLRTGQPWSA